MAETHITAAERLLWTADGKVVPAGDPAGVRLFAVPGQKIPIAQANQLGLANSGRQSGVRAKLKRLWNGPPQDKAYHG